ncbi:MAG: endonuclease/exonuclease/phosphatase family protein [Chitinophagales bacterium]
MSILRKLILFLNVIASLSLIAAGLCIYVNPERLWIISFFGLLFPYLLPVNVFFILFWIVVQLRYTIISFIAMVIILPLIKTYFGFHFNEKLNTSSAPAIKVMSYNVRNFDLYNWSNEAATLDKIMMLITSEKPDIACFQEFFNADTGKFETISRLMHTKGFKYYSFSKTVTRKHYGSWGVATFSRYPIINHGDIKFKNSKFNSSLFTDIKIDSNIVRVFNAHLQSVYFSKGDYEYLEHISTDQELHVKPSRQIVSKIKRAFLLRAPQAISMHEKIKKSQYPVIVCGDFNDTPASFAYHAISSTLQDAFICAGWGIAPTYSLLFFPYRIDYILCDKHFSVSNYKTHCEDYSDHYAIECMLSFSSDYKKM